MSGTGSPSVPEATTPDTVTAGGVLWRNGGAGLAAEDSPEPDFFADLNLDQVVDAVTAGRAGYRLRPFLYRPLSDPEAIAWRQEVFRDADRPEVSDALDLFGRRMQAMRETAERAAAASYHYQEQRWRLDAIAGYCAAVTGLATDLAGASLRSRGLLGVCDYLASYVCSGAFAALDDQARGLIRAMDEVRYCLLVKGNRITVGPYDGESDYSAEVTGVFDRFRPGAPPGRRAAAAAAGDMNRVEAGVLELVARVYPDVFAALDDFCGRHRAYLDPVIGVFDREIQFYLAYLSCIAPLRKAGLSFSYPHVSAVSKDERADATFDLALAIQLTRQQEPVVGNDIALTGPERILVVSGPNNGGKTTLARAFGQLHYLARLGCPVPGRDVRLFLCDQIFTHFEKDENLATLAGKLQDELNRLRDDFGRATSSSVIIMNEMFSSTTLADALFLSREMLSRVTGLDALGVCVTFLDELAAMNDKTVSMVAAVVPGNPASRTFHLIRRPADGRAYAEAIAEKYGLTYEALTERIGR